MNKKLGRWREPDLSRKLLARVILLARTVAERLGRLPVFMEVCGTHTVAISRTGLRGLLAGYLELRSGPGCPVCVTDGGEIERMIMLARLPEVTVATFGDMLRVPGRDTSLEEERARGARVEVVYSPADAVALAEAHPEKQVVFLGVGFETTAPTVALALAAAAEKKLPNFTVYSAHKLVPPVMRALLHDPGPAVDGFILPGHVCAVTGRAPFDFIAEQYGLPAVITGFEPLDILGSVYRLLEMILSGHVRVLNGYTRVVREAGNREARLIMNKYFRPVDAFWRGFGPVPESGLALRERFGGFDAARRFALPEPATAVREGCRCGDLLRGRINPRQCPLFAAACTPARPVGPCMVSSEGACAAYYQYERNR